MYKIHFETLGCKLNQIESEALAQSFSKAGFHVAQKLGANPATDDEKTILAIVNTCTVTGKAEQKTRRVIRLLLKKFPDVILLVTGCYATVEEKAIERIDTKRVIAISGKLKDHLVDLPEPLYSFLQKIEEKLSLHTWISNWKKNVIEGSSQKQSASFRLSADDFQIHSRASLKIQDGCNSDCSYCRIHLARGKAISLSVQEVLNRVLLLESKGHAEVVLVGVNLSQYAGTFENSPQTNEAHVYNFSKLLQFLLENTQSIAFRISSLYPQQITDEFCSVITSNRIRPHFHLSVQSGSDQILQKMNRNYSRNDITDAVKKLRKAKNNPFIACDIIVGFPSET
ncbi:MAG: radical SAM protein, partial [Treponemataceae bacterium]